jgi:hypothetical protein
MSSMFSKPKVEKAEKPKETTLRSPAERGRTGRTILSNRAPEEEATTKKKSILGG